MPRDSEAAELAALTSEIRDWTRGLALSGRMRAAVDVGARWVCQCAPSSQLDHRLLASLDLSLFLFYPDDNLDDVILDGYEQVLSGLRGGTLDPRSPSAIVLRLVEEFERRGLWSPRHVQGRVELLTALRRRNEWRESKYRPSFDEYLELRKTTIYIRQWVELWASVLGLPECVEAPEHLQRASMRLLDEALCFEVFQNEVVSLSRDVLANTPNLVLLLARDEQIELADAARHLRGARDERHRSFHQTMIELQREAGGWPGIVGRAAILEAVVRETSRYYTERQDAARYDPWEG